MPLAGGMCKRWFELIFHNNIIKDNDDDNDNKCY
jgi:hypothetical protein